MKGGGLKGVSSATYLFWDMIFFENHLESFPDCWNVGNNVIYQQD